MHAKMSADDVLAHTCVAVLAAGGSVRMGTPKQVLRLQGEALAQRACKVALAAGAAEVCVIAGCACDEVEDALCGMPVTTVYNGCWEAGQAGSVRLAANYARQAGAQWLAILPVDMPYLTPSHVRALAQAATQTGAIAASASPEGSPMAPCLFPESAFCLFDSLKGDAGAVRVLRAPGVHARVVQVPFENALQAQDCDTPAEFARAQQLLERA